MLNQNLIEATFMDFVANDSMFTSVDIGNTIKEKGDWVSNSDVADWLRTNAAVLAPNYIIATISVMHGTQMARLYHPIGTNPDDYQTRDQSALPPTPHQKNSPIHVTSSSSTTSTVVSKTKKMKIRSDSQERLRIPKSLIQKLGMYPGDVVDTSKILVNKGNLSKKLKVHKDGRILIKRKLIAWNDGPVLVFVENGNLCFEKP